MAGQPTILKVERHKVRNGESLDSIARSAELNWQDLAAFNWGTTDPDEINVHLRDDVGCTRRTGDGANYVVSDFDYPGIVLVPRRWSEEGLRTDRVHKVKVQPLMLVVDYEFRHDAGNTALCFTIRGRQPDELFVRLYECSTRADAQQRERAILAHAADFQDNPGYRKSGRYCEVQDGDSLESLARQHGLSDARLIRGHFENSPLREALGDSFSVQTGDFLFVPQISTDGPVPLGDLLSVELSGEQVQGGTRYTATWNNADTGYDPLDWTSWLPGTESSIPVLRNMDFPSGESAGSIFYVPQFAVLIGGYIPIGVSPAPLWLVHMSEFERPSESDAFHAFLADDTPRPMGDTTGEFEGPEEPLTFYSALNPESDDPGTE